MMFSREPSKVYSHKTRTEPPRGETELYWKNIWEKEVSHNTNALDIQQKPGSLRVLRSILAVPSIGS